MAHAIHGYAGAVHANERVVVTDAFAGRRLRGGFQSSAVIHGVRRQTARVPRPIGYHARDARVGRGRS